MGTAQADAEVADLAAKGVAPRGRGQTSVEIRLIRHGQTQSYAADTALTPRGEQQARKKGRALAERLRPGAVVHIPHAPTARATRTAEVLAAGLTDAVAERELADVWLAPPTASDWFDNFRIWCDGEVLEPTQAFGQYEAARQAGAPQSWPGWVREMHHFQQLQLQGEDPIQWWLTQPVQYFEPAANAVRRFWQGIRHTIADPDRVPDGASFFVCTHSGCIRAVAAAALGFDPGEPEHTEDVRIRVLAGHTHAQLDYREHSVHIEIPVHDAPWTV